MKESTYNGEQTRAKMRQIVASHCLLRGVDVRLSAGGESSVYFDCKRATLRGDFLPLFADWILDEARPRLSPAPRAVGGPTLGADFIVAAVVVRAAQRGIDLTFGAIARKEPKQHGVKNRIENEPESPSPILIVEDVITTGGSIARACDEFLAAGHSIAGIAALVDREAGGREALAQKYDAPVFALFQKSEFE